MKLRILLVVLVLAAQGAAIFSASRSREIEQRTAPKIRLACQISPLHSGFFGKFLTLKFDALQKIPFEKFDAAAQATLRAKLFPAVVALAANSAATGTFDTNAAAQKCGIDGNDVWLVLEPNPENETCELVSATFSEPPPTAGAFVLRSKISGFTLAESVRNVPETPPPSVPENVARNVSATTSGTAPENVAEAAPAPENSIAPSVAVAENASPSAPENVARNVPATPNAPEGTSPSSVPVQNADKIFLGMSFSVAAERCHFGLSEKKAERIFEKTLDRSEKPAFSADVFRRDDGTLCVARIFIDGEALQ